MNGEREVERRERGREVEQREREVELAVITMSLRSIEPDLE